MSGQTFIFRRSREAPARAKRARTASNVHLLRTVKKDEARAAPDPPAAPPMRTVILKTVKVGEQLVTLCSFDGRTWASEVQDLIEYKERGEREILHAKAILIVSYVQRFKERSVD